MSDHMKDLVILAADKQMLFAMKGALTRPDALGIRALECDFRKHPNRDGGVRTTGPEFLNLYRQSHSRAVMVMDFEGSGASETALELEDRLNNRLSEVWRNDAVAIVVEPEMDIWVWGTDNAIAQVIRWKRTETIRNWLQNRGFIFDPNGKPVRPKEAIEAVLRESRQPHSASLYEKITRQISLQRCRDAAFLRLKKRLIQWFPPV